MPSAVIAGLPIAYDARLRRTLPAGDQPFRAGWSVVVIRSKSRDVAAPNLEGIHGILGKAAMIEAHVFAFRPKQPVERDRVRDSLMPYFRFTWLDNGLLSYFPNAIDRFVESVGELLAVEEEWIRHVKPGNVRSPLILPERSFVPYRGYERMWDLAGEAAGADRIRGAARAIETFNRAHRVSTGGGHAMMDSGGQLFDHGGPRHGVAPFPRWCKYSYRIPDGFHFDVTSGRGREFRIYDCEGRVHDAVAGGHINIDAHGHVI